MRVSINTHTHCHIIKRILVHTYTYTQFSPANVGSMAGQRVEEGNLTINFEGLNWNMVVINDAKDKAALRKLYELLGEMHTGEMPSGKEK